MMHYLTRITALGSAFLFFAGSLYSQDSAIYKWNASAKKKAEKFYEITFTTGGVNGWQLYAPGQSFDEFKSAEIILSDSTIGQTAIEDAGSSKIIKSQVFDNTNVKVYEAATVWKQTIHFDSIVPSQLQGKLNYSYGRNDEFYTGAFAFTVSLEGGVASTTRIKIESIDIDHPIDYCGDDVTRNKSMVGIFILGLLGGFIALLTPCVFPM